MCNNLPKVSEKITKITVSIKVSILSLFAALLMLVGSILIFVDYRTSLEILRNSAENLVKYASKDLQQFVAGVLLPITNRVGISGNLIKNGIINPHLSKPFAMFLLDNLNVMPLFYAAYWADPNGQLNLVEKEENNVYLNEMIVRVNNKYVVTTEKYDAKGKVIVAPKMLAAPTQQAPYFDPRTRPWYIKASQTGDKIISDVYLFHPFGSTKPVVGITFAYPIYSEQNKLLGIYGVDVRLSTLSEFITTLKLTPNSVTFIFDQQHNLIAAKKLQDYKKKTLPKIENLEIPWVDAAINLYTKFNKKVFSYKYKGEDYLAYYEEFRQRYANNWIIGIALPYSDVTSELHKKLLFSVLFAVGILFFGMFLVWIVAMAISKPVTRLADETRLIKQLKLESCSYIHSHITEIVNMRDAFNSMKQSLASFARYVPITLIKKLISSGAVAEVGGENKIVTFLFTDISGFTSLSENMEPQKLMDYLSEYLQNMTKHILHSGGTVDKYMGDAIMAFWGAPTDDAHHAFHACQSCLNMSEELVLLNKQWKVRGLPELVIRMGVNTGTAVIGNIGSEDRLSYSAIGDSVNLANRIEYLNKVYASQIIVSQSTYDMVKDVFNFRLLDNVVVRGRNEGVFIYELLPEKNQFGSELMRYNQDFQLAFACYQQGKWQKALELFTMLKNNYPQDNLVNIYLTRCNLFIKQPPQNWDGTWKF